jgi:arsenite-transporting ATPase
MTELMMFTGKGGVGKSTTSSATAVHFAEQGKKVLLVSSDPAHNLGDLFDMKFTNTPKQINDIPNLWVKEIDAIEDATHFMDMMNESMRKVLKKSTSVDMDVFKDLMMPGIDEVFAMKSLLEDMKSSQWDLIVFDTAPTGHTLRALTSPDFMDAWLLRMLALRKKVKSLKGILFKTSNASDEITDYILPLREKIGEIKSILSQPQSSIFLVTIPEKLSVMETYRTLNFLNEGLKVNVGGVIVNRIMPDFGDEWGADLNIVRLAKGEFDIHAENLKLANNLFGQRVRLIQVPKVAFQPVGVGNLRKFSNLIWRN